MHGNIHFKILIHLMKITLIIFSLFLVSSHANAKNCTTGQPCGNSCISWSYVCHINTYVPPTPTCYAPQVLQNNICVTPTPTCYAPQVLQNNICVTPIPTCYAPQVLQNNICITPTTIISYDTQVKADGIYDGIYSIPNYGYITIREHNGYMVVFFNQTDGSSYFLWGVGGGNLIGSTAKIIISMGYTRSEVNLSFVSSATVTTIKEVLTSCTSTTPSLVCPPNGTSYTGTKIW